MNSSDNMTLLVLTPHKTVFEGPVAKVELPGDKGRFMVLKNHAPLISSLQEGDVVYMSEGTEGRIRVLSGFVRINENKVIVCAEV